MNSHLLSYYRNVSRVASGVVLTVGILVLAGWLFDTPALKSILPGFVTMKANTALAFTLAGSSLWLASIENKNKGLELIAKTCATIIILIGLLTLSEYIFTYDPGIDQLLFKDLLTPANVNPGRMSVVTALNFTLLGFSLLLLGRKQNQRLVDVLTITALLISLLALIGYAYGAKSLYNFFPYSSVALHTAFSFLFLCIGIFSAHPEMGWMKIFSPAPLGFLAIARSFETKIAVGGTAAELTVWNSQLFNNRVDAAVTAVFLILVAIVVVASVRIWWQLLSGQRTASLREEPYVPAAAAESA